MSDNITQATLPAGHLAVELSEYITLALRDRDFGYIGEARALAIKAIPGYEAHCIVENSEHTIDWLGQPMPKCNPGIYRLWNKESWVRMNNHVNANRVRVEQAHKLRELRREKAREIMVETTKASGIDESFIDLMLSSFTDKQIENMLDQAGVVVTLENNR